LNRCGHGHRSARASKDNHQS
jgi:hypothetical protein